MNNEPKAEAKPKPAKSPDKADQDFEKSIASLPHLTQEVERQRRKGKA